MAKIGTFIVKGIAQWAKVFESNRDMEGYQGKFAEHGGAYVIDLVVDEDNMEIYEDSGSAGKIRPAFWNEDGNVFTDKRKDAEGNKFVAAKGKYILKFKRKHEERKKADGGPPKVLFEGEVMDGVDMLIGNGSEVEVKFTTYSTKKSNGTRLEAIRVLELVEFEPYDDEDEDVDSGDEEDDGFPF